MDDRKPDLLEVMKRSGMKIPQESGDRNIMLRCPFHDDKGRPNLSVRADVGLFYCFRCGSGGDVYDFQGRLIYGDAWDNRDREMFKRALEQLEGMHIPKIEPGPAPPPKELKREVAQVLALASRVYHFALMAPSGVKAREYLESRGIEVEAMRRRRLGYASPGALFGALAPYPPSARESAKLAGLFLHDDGDPPGDWLSFRVVFPDVTQRGTVRHMIGRSLGGEAGLKYLSLGGLPKTIWGSGDVDPEAPVILTESIIDAVNLRQMGLQGIATNGTGLASYLVPGLQELPHLLLLPQNDPAGEQAVRRWMKKLPHARRLTHAYAEGEKDLNDQVMAYGLKAMANALRGAVQQALTAASKEPDLHTPSPSE